jgi:hypothetical protein
VESTSSPPLPKRKRVLSLQVLTDPGHPIPFFSPRSVVGRLEVCGIVFAAGLVGG